MIKAEVVAHSLSPQGEEILSVLATFPRIILAEVNTHRMLSKNTSSSRAIPFAKMVETVKNNPFIPIAWQKDHKGMQGSEYWTNESANDAYGDTQWVEDYRAVALHKSNWLLARDEAVNSAIELNRGMVTKQLTNRLLEPFMWTTMLITGPKSGWDNFFHLRCPSYESHKGTIYKSWKDYVNDSTVFIKGELASYDTLERLQFNKGLAEIHIMDLAEKIWDARNESTPKQLKAGEWHIPFRDKIDAIGIPPLIKTVNIHSEEYKRYIPPFVKISVAMGARTSYTTVGEEKEINPEALIGLHDRLLTQEPPHSSPMEHCNRAMSDEEYNTFHKGRLTDLSSTMEGLHPTYNSDNGWCYNMKGFIPYRYLIDNSLTL